MSGAFLYQWVLSAPGDDRMDAVQALGDPSLRTLAAWLSRDFAADETTGEVLGLCVVEGFARFARGVRQAEAVTINEEEVKS